MDSFPGVTKLFLFLLYRLLNACPVFRTVASVFDAAGYVKLILINLRYLILKLITFSLLASYFIILYYIYLRDGDIKIERNSSRNITFLISFVRI